MLVAGEQEKWLSVVRTAMNVDCYVTEACIQLLLSIRPYQLPFVPDFYINSNDRKKHTVYNFGPLKFDKTRLSAGWSL